MNITHITIENFLGARHVDLRLSTPIGLIAGRNASGKSSILEAVRMAITGAPVRVDLKKHYPALVSDGASAASISVVTSDGTYAVDLPGGKGNASTNPMLHFAFDGQRFAAMPATDRLTMLYNVMGVALDGPAVRDALTARDVSARHIELLMPIIRAGFPAAHDEAARRAKDGKAAWRAITGETWGKDKAPRWTATAAAAVGNPQLIADTKAALDKARADMDAAQQRIGQLTEAEAAYQRWINNRTSLHAKAEKLARLTTKATIDRQILADVQAKVDAARGASRAELTCACPHCGGMLSGLLEGDTLALTPYVLPEPGMADSELTGSLSDYEAHLASATRAASNSDRDLQDAKSAAAALAELDANVIAAPSVADIEAARAEVSRLRHEITNHEAALRMVDDAARAQQKAARDTETAAAHHADIMAWITAADALAPDGIPADMLAKALGPFNAILEKHAEATGWRCVSIDQDAVIAAAGRPYALHSESERWRMDAILAATISELTGTRLLALDRMDVLDLSNRATCLLWLVELVTKGVLDTVLIGATLKAPPAALPSCVTAAWISERGECITAPAMAA